MANLNVDTTKMRECGNDIMNISLELDTEFNNLFERIAKMPTQTLEWTGVSAINFSNSKQAEKVQYMQLKDTLYNYGKYLVQCADELDTTISSLR